MGRRDAVLTALMKHTERRAELSQVGNGEGAVSGGKDGSEAWEVVRAERGMWEPLSRCVGGRTVDGGGLKKGRLRP